MSRRFSQKRWAKAPSAPTDALFRPPNPQFGRKKLQLCRQVQEALTWALGSATSDERLGYCSVEGVEPLVGGNRLLVKVGVPPDLPVSEVAESLAAATPALRAEVAQAVTRRKAPELVFLPVPSVRG
jgi:ribosome-binding factor A